MEVFSQSELNFMPQKLKSELLLAIRDHQQSVCQPDCIHIQKALQIKSKAPRYPIKYHNFKPEDVNIF